jgi:hypothetical protein
VSDERPRLLGELEFPGRSAKWILSDLLRLFPSAGIEPADLERIEPREMPEPYRTLLVHREHMTVTLEEHHGSKVDLVVLERRREGDDYARRLILTAGPGGKVVLAGIMKLRLDVAGEAVRRRVVEEGAPLGRILIEHDVLRVIEPLAYLRVRMSPAIADLFRAPGAAGFTYARVAAITCSTREAPRAAEPAVELLEIVRPEVP